MYPLRAGQSQVLTAVILGGIILAAITSAFIWGVPLLEKNQDVNTAENSLADMKEVANGIEAVAQNGGSRSVSVRLGPGALNIDADDESITYQASTKGVYVSTEDWVPLNENDMQGVSGTSSEDGYGIRGVDKHGVLVGRAQRTGDQYLTMYRLVYRQLKEPNSQQTYQIDLVQNGNLRASNGDHTITFQRGDTTIDPGAGVNGGPLQKIEIQIRVS